MQERRIGRASMWLTIAIAFCSFALLGARAADAQIVASGTTLTVTTTNAVATFNGPDLVGFVNSLTHETYLKNPSSGDLAQVDAITSTGQPLQSSNWSVGTDPGTGAPMATITGHDSVRTFALSVKIDSSSQEIVLNSSAGVTSGGVRGASWAIAGLDLTTGRWIVPANSGVVFDRDHPGLNTTVEYPFSWQAQMAVYEASQGSFLLYSTDGLYAFKQLRQTSRADDTLDVAVFTEAEAPWPSASNVPAVEWRLKAYAGDWRIAAQSFRTWLLANRPPVSSAAHPWVANIRTVIGVSSGNQDTSLLAPLAAQVNPSQTLLYMIDWRQTGYDINYPDYTPAPGTAAFISAAHALGFKVMLHTDLEGVAPANADYAAVQAYQARTSETLQPMGWNWDQPPSTPQRYAIINPAAAAFRSLWIGRVAAAVAALNPDALHLDFNGIYNDGNGRIGGLTFPQGIAQFHSEIVSAFPSIALGGELQTDVDYRFYSFAQAGLDLAFVPAVGHPIATFLFSPQTLTYGHLSTPSVTGGGVTTASTVNGRFKAALIEDQRRAVFPLRHVDSLTDLDATNPDIARFIGIAQTWQNGALAPAWTADWTGALIRYQGAGAATAAFTDSGNVLSLSTPLSAVFQVAHDASQLATGSFIDHWPAFDGSTLYGVDPANLYFVDPLPRPITTHATSLPPDIRVGSSSRVSGSFAHLELEGATPFDFDDPTFPHAHAGVRYQGADYPLANGAVVNRQNTTVGGVTRSGIFIHPPWQAQIGGETFVEYSVPIPASAALRFSVGIDDGASCTDGVTFRVTAGGVEIWHGTFDRGSWHDVAVSLAAYGGATVSLRLISNPGPAANPNCDWSSWTNIALAAPNPTVSVPITLAPGAAFSGIDGATYSATSSSSGTVTTTAAPGAFTIFTQPGPTVGSGTNLATVPFETWQGATGELARPGTIDGAGTVGAQTAGGVVKNPAIFAHPPNPGRTVLSWVVRLPANPLQLGWSAGVMDGANSSDGVDFDVRINGQPYWRLTDGANGTDRWTSGSLNLSRWSGQSILLELTTDSRADNTFDWAAWADLVLSASSVSCAYAVPASASVGAFGGSFSAAVTATATCPWSASSSASWIAVTSGSGAGNGSVTYTVAPNAGEGRTGVVTIGGQTLTITQDATAANPPTMTLDRSALVFTGVIKGAAFTAVTGAQTIRITQSGSGTVMWAIGALPPWLTVTPTSGSGSATLTVSAQFTPGLAATQAGPIPITLTGAGNTAGPISVTLNSISSTGAAPPFGSFDTPTNGTTGVAGSIAVTGWALDDVQVTRVSICRDGVTGETAPVDANCAGSAQIYIGDAIFIDGARTDVQAQNPTLPLNSRGGWGYLLLTNFLPNLGNGIFTLRAYAFDADGHSTALGAKTITCDNAHATKPFGAIDTPAQGGVVSGTIGTSGWVLTQSPKDILANSSTVTAVIDGVAVGTLDPGRLARADITALFSPAYDTSHAAGGKAIDTTAFANGLHTLFWFVTDTGGQSDGIGSRFFTISNGSLFADAASRLMPDMSGAMVVAPRASLDLPRAAAARLASAETLAAEIAAAPADPGAIRGRRGFDLERALQTYTPSGSHIDVQAEELDRVELHLSATPNQEYSGYQRTPAGLRPLPIGSTLDASTGLFTWAPGAGFYGAYDLAFVRWSGGRAVARQDVQITLNAKGSNRVGPQTIIDAPGAGTQAGSPFVVGGWAADLDSAVDSGVNTVHVWAYPVDASAQTRDPVFLGPAAYGGARPDVGAVYGDRFTHSGYGLIVNGLAPGTYDIAVFAFSTVANGFTPAKVVRVVVR